MHARGQTDSRKACVKGSARVCLHKFSSFLPSHPSVFSVNLRQTSVLLLAVLNNAGYLLVPILEFAASSTVFTGFSLDERKKPSKSKCRWTV
jgi:hypothetical protein